MYLLYELVDLNLTKLIQCKGITIARNIQPEPRLLEKRFCIRRIYDVMLSYCYINTLVIILI